MSTVDEKPSQAKKFKEIADAIRTKTGKTEDIVANEFATEIQSIERLTPMNIPLNGFSNGYYGNRVARVAATYYFARVSGDDDFVYNQEHIFKKGNPTVRDANGHGYIDCSAFVGLVLRGITYDKSPYAKHKSANEGWVPSTELPTMYGTEGWELTYMDKQPELSFSDFGFAGYSSFRTAAHIGEFLYRQGYVVFDVKRDGNPTAALANKLEPGDVLFWSKKKDGEYVNKKRFRYISHIAIVAERPDKFYHVTDDGDTSNVLLYGDFEDKYENISLICRPNYCQHRGAEEIPIGVNLLGYPWGYSLKPEAYEKNGITLKMVNMNTISISGKNTELTQFSLKGFSTDKDSCMTLTPGTYQLSGMSNTGIESKGVALQVVDSDGEHFNTAITCYDSNNPTFTITKNTKVIVRLHFGENDGAGYKVNCNITPTLKRKS